MILTACAPAPVPTPIPTAKITPTLTSTPRPTFTPTPAPIFVTIGSPFPLEWDTPRIWANDSFNAPFDRNRIDMYHGHMDVAVPEGYSNNDGFDLNKHSGDVIAPLSGEVVPYEDNSSGLHLYLPNNTYLSGTLAALEFAGIENPNLKYIEFFRLDLGHLQNVKSGFKEKGEVIADIEPKGFNFQALYFESGVGFQVGILYKGIEYLLSPTLFDTDIKWVCHPKQFHDCEPESHDYAP